jgi:hypothetical protein
MFESPALGYFHFIHHIFSLFPILVLRWRAPNLNPEFSAAIGARISLLWWQKDETCLTNTSPIRSHAKDSFVSSAFFLRSTLSCYLIALSSFLSVLFCFHYVLPCLLSALSCSFLNSFMFFRNFISIVLFLFSSASVLQLHSTSNVIHSSHVKSNKCLTRW